jgi:hypothetical protein
MVDFGKVGDTKKLSSGHTAFSGVDIMITLFWEFRQFSAFFSKTNVMINFL